MTEFVLGFSFTHDYSGFDRVLLIRKTKPDWQAGQLNGIGGKIEVGESQHEAMSREFKEECGLESLPSAWHHFATMQFPEAHVFCFVTWWDWKTFKRARSTTEESIVHFQLDDRLYEKLCEAKALRNLQWLIPMGYSVWKAPWTGNHIALTIEEFPGLIYNPRIP